MGIANPADVFSNICYDFAKLENKMKLNAISNEDSLAGVNAIDTRLVQWSIDTMANADYWRYYDLQVEDSVHVWDGMVSSIQQRFNSSKLTQYNRSMPTQDSLAQGCGTPFGEYA